MSNTTTFDTYLRGRAPSYSNTTSQVDWSSLGLPGVGLHHLVGEEVDIQKAGWAELTVGSAQIWYAALQCGGFQQAIKRDKMINSISSFLLNSS